MNRRDTLKGVAGLAIVVPACSGPGSETAASGDLEIEWLLRHVAGVEPLPGEAARVREGLMDRADPGVSDPRVQPAALFDPVVEA